MYPSISKPEKSQKTPEKEHISYIIYYWKGHRQFKFILGEFNSKQIRKLVEYDIKKPTVFVTHGWLGSCDIPTASDIVKGKYKVKFAFQIFL